MLKKEYLIYLHECGEYFVDSCPTLLSWLMPGDGYAVNAKCIPSGSFFESYYTELYHACMYLSIFMVPLQACFNYKFNLLSSYNSRSIVYLSVYNHACSNMFK